LHLGHVVNAIYVWGMARALGGQVRLRIEDHDRVRCRPEFEAALLDDLAWLGFEPDATSRPSRRQSDSSGRYQHALDQLRHTHAVYGCRCSRKDIAVERYDGRCRNLALSGDAPGVGLRVGIPPGVERAEDALLGPLVQEPATQCGDVLVRDRDGQWTYQFAVVVDDLADGITLVVRGADLLDSTGRQVALGRLLKRPNPPLFLHHPLVLRPDGRKLSKSAGESGVRDLRGHGVSAAEVIGLAAAAVGLLTAPRPLQALDVPTLFLG
jgi:glutamyl-tRNA synthetase/glutamyl-Q tRNA(Asp) synthetase